VFPHTNDSHEAPGSTYEDDDDDTTDFNLSLHMSTSIDEITDDIISRKLRSPAPDPRQDAPRRRHTTVTSSAKSSPKTRMVSAVDPKTKMEISVPLHHMITLDMNTLSQP